MQFIGVFYCSCHSFWGYIGSAIRLWLFVYEGYTIEEDSKIEGGDAYRSIGKGNSPMW